MPAALLVFKVLRGAASFERDLRRFIRSQKGRLEASDIHWWRNFGTEEVDVFIKKIEEENERRFR